MLRKLNSSCLLAARPMQTKSLARTFETSEEVLSFYERNSGLAVGQLEPILSQMSFILQSRGSQESPATLFGDERFVRLLLQSTSDMASCDSSQLVRFAQAASKLPLPKGGCAELTELCRKIAEVASSRTNAFSPASLSQLSFALASRGVSDPALVEFVRMETMKLVQDFLPENAVMMLEAFRRFGVFNRELVDNLIERLTDEVDRFTPKDIVNCVSVFSKLGLGRGYLLRRLHRLAFENLSLFSDSQLVRLLSGFGKLRFLTNSAVESVLETLEERGSGPKNPATVGELLFACALANYQHPSALLDRLVVRIGSELATISVSGQVDVAWALCVLDETQVHAEVLRKIAQSIYAIPPPTNRQLLLKMLEVTQELDLAELLPEADAVSAQWRSAMDDAEKAESNRYEGARLHAEVLALTESIKPQPGTTLAHKVALLRNAQVGGYRVDLYDEKNKLVVDIDTLARPTSLVLKHRQLKQKLGTDMHVIGLQYWDIRRFKTLEEQHEWLRSLIVKKSSKK